MKVAFKPVNFFDKNPSLDVPPSTQEFNKSVLVGAQQQGTTGAKADACCDGESKL
jgi:primary-amine oxidase